MHDLCGVRARGQWGRDAGRLRRGLRRGLRARLALALRRRSRVLVAACETCLRDERGVALLWGSGSGTPRRLPQTVYALQRRLLRFLRYSWRRRRRVPHGHHLAAVARVYAGNGHRLWRKRLRMNGRHWALRLFYRNTQRRRFVLLRRGGSLRLCPLKRRWGRRTRMCGRFCVGRLPGAWGRRVGPLPRRGTPLPILALAVRRHRDRVRGCLVASRRGLLQGCAFPLTSFLHRSPELSIAWPGGRRSAAVRSLVSAPSIRDLVPG